MSEIALRQIIGRPSLSIVVPVFRNAPSLATLVERIDAAMAAAGLSHEILLVDDASPDDSWARIRTLATASSHLHGLRHARNEGQHVAAMTGLTRAQGEICVVMDADLQDRPEAIAGMVARLQQGDAEVVFAGRVGDYQSWPRMLSSRLYRHVLLGGLTRLPTDAGMYFAITRSGLARLRTLRPSGQPMLIGLLAAAGLRCESLPAARAEREHGTSAYSSWRRLRSALRMARCALFSARAPDGSGWPQAVLAEPRIGPAEDRR
ncbi:glycosyltransferase family 2 protein [Arenimonas oryziterrae]|uniref:Glycosyltransferase 2-like domain-containing protein n=1 Tax=Arenimonas oryziterrae DSM 21050 = YC6267 TaxID=1121015 RepID=A0A091AWF7_9GAMM|nr:glycosyltransferase family 2 protein [Arenimonas oryziterrae]KFN44633.1 hypothetical protein N789_01085 [Arenimonas oryziterrae DSM 21050 = YC6267]